VVPTRPVQKTAIHHHCVRNSSARAYGTLGSQLMTLYPAIMRSVMTAIPRVTLPGASAGPESTTSK
jgi:hypothetical protein